MAVNLLAPTPIKTPLGSIVDPKTRKPIQLDMDPIWQRWLVRLQISVSGVLSGGSTASVAISGPITIDSTYAFRWLLCSGTFTVTLPTAVGIDGTEFWFKNTGSGVITIVCDGIETIDGNLTFELSNPSQYVKLFSGNVNWGIGGNN